jgi:large conductance mechanosensitive channel
MFAEFKKFLIGGNVIDMAVGFIFGAAFATLVKSLVANIIMPPIGLLMGKADFTSLFIALDGKHYTSLKELEAASAPAIKYGAFLNDTVAFVILGFVVFLMVKGYNKVRHAQPSEPATTKICGECGMSIPLVAKVCPYCQGAQH